MNPLKKIFSIVTSDVSEDKTFYLILALSSLIWIAGFCVLSAYTIAAVLLSLCSRRWLSCCFVLLKTMCS